MTSDLGTSARQALIALMVRVTPASNPDLRESYRVQIDKATRQELADAGLISWRKGLRGAIFHELTERGWIRARQEFVVAPPERVSSAWLLHYATLRHLASIMERNDHKIADVFAATDPGPETAPSGKTEDTPLEDRIKRAYSEVAESPGDLVSLFSIRERLADFDRAELDRALKEMDRRREIHLDPDPRRNELPQEVLDAAIAVGGEDKHLLTIGQANGPA
ncbi:hypothetical protein [Actinoplanes friuliensis]|uniref:hypothetical protein n=1 Tax=Actinoplanes friuliensis TaxID=196914 RepID=UPI0011DD223F|nr:hypothetical protein [Actinoplanes friuliensis]